jgi:glycosyltransferase involved in cell wall biosynthesis
MEQRSQVRLAGFRYHPAIGGAEQHARRMLREIADRLSIDVVTVVTSNRTDWLTLLIDGVRDHDEWYEVDGRTVHALGRWPAETRRKLGRLKPFYHFPWSPAPGLMAQTLAPHLQDAVSGTDLVHNVFMGREAFSLGLLLATHRAGKPFMFTPLRHQRPLGWNSPAFKQLYREADALVALSRAEADWLVSQGARRERIRVIGIGPLSNPSAPPEPARELIGAGKIVLFLGQLHTYKGYRAVLGAARLLQGRQDVRFVFAGPDLRGHARAFATAGPNVRYLSTVADAVRDSLLQACTVVCVPSSRESFGGVLVDAWACGKPVIGGPAGATRELIEDGVDGWAVAQDPRVIADRIATLLDNPQLAEQMGARGKAKVEARFSWAAIAQAHLAMYQDLLEDGRLAA